MTNAKTRADIELVNRQQQLRDILSKKKQRPSVDQLVKDLESLDSLKRNRPDWIKRLESRGDVKLKRPTVAKFFPRQIADKRHLERVRDGLTALKKVFDGLPLDMRRALARTSFMAAQKESDGGADVALQALFEHVLAGVKYTIADLSRDTPSSDADLQRKLKVLGIAATFHRHGVTIGVGSSSPFVAVCGLFGISHNTVRTYRQHLDAKTLRQAVADLYGR